MLRIDISRNTIHENYKVTIYHVNSNRWLVIKTFEHEDKQQAQAMIDFFVEGYNQGQWYRN